VAGCGAFEISYGNVFINKPITTNSGNQIKAGLVQKLITCLMVVKLQ
jgi:hypothetical protein